MESSLTPRDIQTRIRRGETVEEVAEAAGITVERVHGFAVPVIAVGAVVVRYARQQLAVVEPGPGSPPAAEWAGRRSR